MQLEDLSECLEKIGTLENTKENEELIAITLSMFPQYSVVVELDEQNREELRQLLEKYKGALNRFVQQNEGSLFAVELIKVMFLYKDMMDFNLRVKYVDIGCEILSAESQQEFLDECIQRISNDLGPIVEASSAVLKLMVKAVGTDTHERSREVVSKAIKDVAADTPADLFLKFMEDHPSFVEFDTKVDFFRAEFPENEHERETQIHVSRETLLSDSFRALFMIGADLRLTHVTVIFQDEIGEDNGGLKREWYSVLTKEFLNPMYALFTPSPGDKNKFTINKNSYMNPEHMDYFKFVGRIIGKAMAERIPLKCAFTKSLFNQILDIPLRYEDLETEDPQFFNSMQYILNNPISNLGSEMNFSTDVEIFGNIATRPLIPNGHNIVVTDENKVEYVHHLTQMKMGGSIRPQLLAFLEGLYDSIPKKFLQVFTLDELELLMCGKPTIDISDLRANTIYTGFKNTDEHLEWFWRILGSFDHDDKTNFLRFVTGSPTVPHEGFASLKGNDDEIQHFGITKVMVDGNRLPTSHTCINQLDLPLYDSYEHMEQCLLTAIREGSERFAFR